MKFHQLMKFSKILCGESLETLADFPLILPLFLKYNTDLLARAAAERLFSTARNVLKLNRCS